MHISNFERLERRVYTVSASARRPFWWGRVATMVPIAILCVAIAFLSAIALQQSGAGVSWTPLG